MDNRPPTPVTSDNRLFQASADVLTRVQQLKPQLSRAEKRVAKLLIESPSTFVSASVREVADIAEVSEATVVRFGYRLGCEGFKDLKILLAQQLAVHQAIQDAQQGLSPTGTANSYIDQICRAAIDALKLTSASVGTEQLHEAAQWVIGAKRVLIYGIGGSSAIMASEAQNRLFRLNIPCTTYTDSYLQRMSASTLGQDDLLLIVSSTGRPRSLLESAELAHYYGARTIAITDRASSLARQVNLCLNVTLSQSGVAHYQPNPMRFSQLAVIDALAHQIALQLGQAAEETLKRVRTSVASMHGIVPQQPIGD